MDQLPHLETFVKSAELNSFTAAAQALGLTQAAISQRIHALEGALGTALFHRQGGRILPTEAGQRLYPYAQRILALHDEARGEVVGCKTPQAGELFLAASSIPGEHLLPAILSVFHARYPHIQIKAAVADSEEVLRRVEHGQVHLALVGRKDDSPCFEFRRFACDQMVLVVTPEHPWSRRRRVTLSDVSQQPLIVREPGSGSRWCLEQALTHAGKSWADLTIALELGSNEAIKEAVLRGVGSAILSTHVVEKELETGRLHALRISDLPLKRDMYLVWDRRRVLPIPARLFMDMIFEASEPPP